MKKIKFIYFDLGGVIVDHISGLIKTAKMFNLDVNNVVQFFQKHANNLDRGIISLNEFENIFEKEFAFNNNTDKRVGEIIVENFGVIQETHDLMLQLATNHSIGILSNVSVDVFNYIKYKELIPNILYDSIVLSAKLKLIKPEKEIFDIALSRSGYKPENILFIDDSKDNIEAARSLGWNGIVFDTKKPKESTQLILKMIELEK